MRIRRVFINCLKRAYEIDVTRLSIVVAFYVMLSLFPILIALGALLPYFQISPEAVQPQLEMLIPAAIYQALEPLVWNLLSTPKGGLLSLGIIGTIWSASKGITQIQWGAGRAHGLSHARHYIASRIASIGILVFLLVLILVLLMLFGYGEIVLHQLEGPFAARLHTMLAMLKWPVTFFAVLVLLLCLLRLIPNLKLRLRDAFPGALFASIGFLALTQLFALYLRFSAASFSAYGVLGASFLLLIWLRALALLILLGIVLNAVLFEQNGKEPQLKENRLDIWIAQAREKLLRRIRKKPAQTVEPDDRT